MLPRINFNFLGLFDCLRFLENAVCIFYESITAYWNKIKKTLNCFLFDDEEYLARVVLFFDIKFLTCTEEDFLTDDDWRHESNDFSQCKQIKNYPQI